MFGSLKKEKIRKSYFYKIFRLYILFLLPILMISVISYYYIKKSIIDEANSYNNNNVNSIAAKIQTDFYELERLSYLVIKNMQHEYVKSLSINSGEANAKNLYELENVYNMLGSLKSAKEDIFRILINIPKSEIIITDDGIYDFQEYYRIFPNLKDFDLDLWNHAASIDYIKVFPTSTIRMGRSNLNGSSNEGHNVIPMAVSYKTFEGINAYIIIDIQEKLLSELLKKNNYMKDIQTFILDNKGEVISHTDRSQLFRDAYHQFAENADLDDDHISGKQIEFQNETYILYAEKLSFPQWTVYSMVPVKEYYSRLNFIVKLLVAINFLILCTGVIAAYFFSNRLYSPIRNLIGILYGNNDNKTKKANFDEIEFIKDHLQVLKDAKSHLELKLNKMKPVINENVVKNIILYGDNSVSEKEIQNLFNEYDIRMNKKYYLLGVCYLYYSRAFAVNFPPEEQRVIRKGIPCIMKEILQKNSEHAMLIELEECRYLIVLNDENMKENFCSLFAKINNIVKEDRQFIKIGLSISEPATSILSLSSSFKAVNERMEFVDLNGKELLVKEETLDKNTAVYVPPNIEEIMKHAIAAGNENEMAAAVDHILTSNLKPSLTPFKFNRIVNLLFEQCDKVIKSYGISVPVSAKYKSDPLLKQYDTEAAKHLFTRLMAEIGTHIKKEPHSDKRHALQEYITEHYMNENLSLQIMADDLNFHTNYLSRLFKEETGKTFTEYLSEVRIEKAKELITQTDFIIDEVAGRVGISNRRTFNRTFKKIAGVSPAMYRIIKS
jgi:two-component system response regulator YesN